jgi:hypothetical protein
MDSQDFWNIIRISYENAQGDWEAQCRELEKQLNVLAPEEIVQFQKTFDKYWNQAYEWDLWGAAYIVGGGCSDDGFMDFRSWLISRGKEVYELGLKNADNLAKIIGPEDNDCQFEKFQYVAGWVWCNKTGKELDEYPQSGSNLGEEPSGQPWDEENLEERFPQLSRNFG